MRQFWAALALLLVLAAVAHWNLRQLDRLACEVSAGAETVGTLASRERFTEAEAALTRVERRWESAGLHVEAFLAQPESDAVGDAIHALREALAEGDARQSAVCAETLRDASRRLLALQRPTLGSVF